MAVSPTLGQLEYIHDNATERSVNVSLLGVPSESFYFDFEMWTPTVLIVILGLVGNSIVVWLLGFRIQRNPFSVYILNLAGADALFLCFSFLHYMAMFWGLISSRVISLVVLFLRYKFCITSMSLLAAISSERCLSVLFPIWYRCHRPKHTSATLCTVLWGVVVMLTAVVCTLCWHRFSYSACEKTIIMEFLWFILLTCILCVSSLTLLLRVQCTSQRRQPPKLYLLVLLTVLVFLLCDLPMVISDFIEFKTKSRFLPYWLPWMLACVNSSANPIIYFFLGNQRCQRREPLRVILQRALENEEVGGGTRDTPHTNIPETSF